MKFFKSKESKKEPDAYDRRRGFERNRSMCMIGAGLLGYQTLQMFFEKDKVPLWFVSVMAGMIGALILIIIKNGKMIEDIDAEIERTQGDFPDSEIPLDEE